MPFVESIGCGALPDQDAPGDEFDGVEYGLWSYRCLLALVENPERHPGPPSRSAVGDGRGDRRELLYAKHA